MTIEERNKKTVEKFLVTMTEGHFDLMAEYGKFWIAGRSRYSGLLSKQQLKDNFALVKNQIQGDFVMIPLSFVAEGNRVVAEARSRVQFKDGRLYENEYLAIYTVESDIITDVREYNDTGYVEDFFGK